MEFTGFLTGQYHIGIYLNSFVITFYQLRDGLSSLPHFNISEIGVHFTTATACVTPR